MKLLGELKRRNVLRVAALYLAGAWLALQVIETGMSLLDLPRWVGRFALIALAIGFPLAIVFSWVYQLTPEGLQRDPGDSGATAAALGRQTGRRIDRWIIAVLALAVTLLLADRCTAPNTAELDAGSAGTTVEPAKTAASQPPARQASVAVLPFANMSGDAADDYFSEGLAEEILNALAQIPELRVPSRTSSFSFRGRDLNLREVAEELQVAHVLEGSVRREGERVRVTAQLIDARSDAHVWSRTWDRTLEGVFGIQEEIARDIAGALEVRFAAGDGGPRPVGTDDLAAYEAYLKARHAWRLRGADNIRESIRFYEEAIQRDPAFARAHAGLAQAWSALGVYSANEPVKPMQAASRAAALRALSIDPRLAEAHTTLAAVLENEGRWREAHAEYRRALELDANDSTALQWHGELLARVGRLKEAHASLERALALDPRSPVINVVYGASLLSTRGDLAGARHYYEKAQALGFPAARVQAQLRDADVYAGDFAAARARTAPDSITARVIDALVDPKARPAALAALDRAPAGSYRTHSSLEAQLAARILLRDIDGAYRAVEQSIVDGSLFTQDFLLTDPVPGLAAFRADPRFEPLVRRLGLYDYWAAEGWPDACRPSGEQLVCDANAPVTSASPGS